MNVDDILKYASTIITLIGAALVIYKSRKMLPSERAAADADTSRQYAEAARMAAEQVTHAIDRIALLEEKIKELENNVRLLTIILDQRDKYIKKLNEDEIQGNIQIKDWMRGVKILLAQILGAGLTPAWSPREWEDSAEERS